MYKVEYYTLAVIGPNTVGNVQQGAGVCYADMELSDIERELQHHLKAKRLFGVITRVDRIKGHLLTAALEVDGNG